MTRGTNRRRRRIWPVAGLMLGVAGLGYLNLYVAQDLAIDLAPLSPPDAANMAARTRAVGPAATLPQVSLADLAETTARPLFSPARRPMREAPPPAPEPAPVREVAKSEPVPSEAQLVGIMKGGPNGARVLVRAAGDRPGRWFSIGDALGGWRLSEIGGDTAVFTSGAERYVLKLYAERAAARDLAPEK